MLQKSGIENELIWFTDGLPAFCCLKTPETKPFLILIEINRLGFGGIELHRRINQHEEAGAKASLLFFLTAVFYTHAIKVAYEMRVTELF